MRGPDLDRERCERRLTPAEFIAEYNEGLPTEYPRASTAVLTAFRASHPELFKQVSTWSLDQHRKRLMDWLPGHVRAQGE